MAKQFRDANCQYGAPMGRRSYGRPGDGDGKIRLFRVRLNSGGYDDGGAYWGTGQPLFCAEQLAGENGEGYRDFARAASREYAAEAMGIDPDLLARGF